MCTGFCYISVFPCPEISVKEKTGRNFSLILPIPASALHIAQRTHISPLLCPHSLPLSLSLCQKNTRGQHVSFKESDSNYSQEIKRCLLLGRKSMTNLDSILKRKDITLLKKSPYSLGYHFFQ